MRIILVSFLAALLLVSCGKEKSVIKSQIIKKYKSTDGQIDSSKFITVQEIQSNEQGLITEFKNYNDDGTLSSFSTITYKMFNDTLPSYIAEKNEMTDKETYMLISYNDIGQRIKTKKWLKQDSSNSQVTIYRYNAKGNIIEENTDNGNDIWVYKYDKNRNRVESKHLDKGSHIYLITYNYDKKNLLVYSTSLYTSDSYTSFDSTTYAYNKDGKVIEENLYDQFHELNSKTEYKYDDKNNVISKLIAYYPYKEKTYKYSSYFDLTPAYETKEPEYKKILTIYEYKYY
ncbi:MAG TPA: hypothetical protein VHO28_00340 [Ignavibacteriales bacterium]|nr:hypothetical protein [Ignavibacteriales bacterium]